ncbi:MAG: hypothetical protein FWF44_05270 [Defluviitaleaceae bacterium]|nr:hypothetical protein [Defluviitaleaceae bacterium]
MNTFEKKVRVLSEVLAEKEDCLARILAVAENQSLMANQGQNGDTDICAMLAEMDAEKQRLARGVFNADRVFERVYAEIAGEFSRMARENPGEVKRLQDAVRRVTDFEIKIRLLDARYQARASSVSCTARPCGPANASRRAFPDAAPVISSAPKISKRELLAEYAKNGKKA